MDGKGGAEEEEKRKQGRGIVVVMNRMAVIPCYR